MIANYAQHGIEIETLKTSFPYYFYL